MKKVLPILLIVVALCSYKLFKMLFGSVIGNTILFITVCFLIVYFLIGIFESKINNEINGYCDMTKHVLLLIFVGWIWQYVWIYRTTNYLNKTPNEEKREPATKLLLCMFVPFYYIYWIYQSAQRIEILAKEKNIDSDIVTLSVVLSLFVGIVPPIIMQSKLNQICKCENKATTVQSVEPNVEINSDKTDEIRNYKKLLDEGIITEEEFEAKKKQLLDL